LALQVGRPRGAHGVGLARAGLSCRTHTTMGMLCCMADCTTAGAEQGVVLVRTAAAAVWNCKDTSYRTDCQA
jgi:hypothetical protein